MKSGRIVSELDSEKSKKVAFHALCSISCPIEKTLTNRKNKKKETEGIKILKRFYKPSIYWNIGTGNIT